MSSSLLLLSMPAIAAAAVALTGAAVIYDVVRRHPKKKSALPPSIEAAYSEALDVDALARQTEFRTVATASFWSDWNRFKSEMERSSGDTTSARSKPPELPVSFEVGVGDTVQLNQPPQEGRGASTFLNPADEFDLSGLFKDLDSLPVLNPDRQVVEYRILQIANRLIQLEPQSAELSGPSRRQFELVIRTRWARLAEYLRLFEFTDNLPNDLLHDSTRAAVLKAVIDLLAHPTNHTKVKS